MAAVAGFNSTSANDLIKTEGIAAVILAANETPRIFSSIAYVLDASANGAPTLRIVRWDSINVPSGVKTETDEADYTSFTTSKADVTSGVVIVRSLLSDELAQDASMTPEGGLARQLVAMSKRMDSDVLGLITSATNTSDSTGSAITLDLWEAARSAYLAQNPVIGASGFHSFVSTPQVISKFQSLLRQAGGAGLVAAAGAMIFNKAPMAEYAGEYQGFQFFQGAAPANDADNTSSAFLAAGDQGALAMGIWWAARPELIRVPGRTGTELVTSSRYGVTVSNQSNLREFITLK